MVKTKKTINLTIPVYNLEGAIEKEITLPDQIFQTQIKTEVLALYVRVYRANQRQGKASAKTRGDVIGSTRKIYRQKGTGRARHGDIKAPIFVGGGVVGGPKPRDYSLKLTKKQKKNALFAALSLKLKNEEIIALSDKFLKIEPKTKNIVQFLNKSKLNKGKKLIVVSGPQKNNLIYATKNLKDIQIAQVQSLNAYQILDCNKILFMENSILNFNSHEK